MSNFDEAIIQFLEVICWFSVIANEAKQSSLRLARWIASSLRSSQ